MSNGSSIIAKLGLDTAGFKSGVAKAKDTLSNFAGALGIGLGVGAVVSFGKSVVDMAGEIQDTADRLDMGVESLQGFQQAFKATGASSNDFNKAMVKLNENIDSALGGNEEVRKSFAAMGISLRDLSNNSADEILLKISDHAKTAGNWSKELSEINDLLGKSGAKMAPGLRQGREAILELSDAASKMSEEQIAALDAFGDKIEESTNQIKVWAGSLMAGFGDAASFLGALTENGFDIGKAADAVNEDKMAAAIKRQQVKNDQKQGGKKIAETKQEEAEKERGLEQLAREQDKREQDAAELQIDLAEKERQKAFDKLSVDEKIADLNARIATEKKRMVGLDEKDVAERKIAVMKMEEEARKLFVANKLKTPEERRNERREEARRARAERQFDANRERLAREDERRQRTGVKRDARQGQNRENTLEQDKNRIMVEQRAKEIEQKNIQKLAKLEEIAANTKGIAANQ